MMPTLACFLSLSAALAQDSQETAVDPLLRHPLVSNSARSLIASLRGERPGITDAEISRLIEAFDETSLDVENGAPRSNSGVRRVQRERADGEVARELIATMPVVKAPAMSAVKFDNYVRSVIFSPFLPPEERVVLYARSRERTFKSYDDYLVEGMIGGRILRESDLRVARDSWLQARDSAGRANLEPLITAIEAQGGEVLDIHGGARILEFEVDAAALSGLAKHPVLGAMEVVQNGGNDSATAYWYLTGTGPYVDGFEMQDLLQTYHFNSRGFLGHNETVGVVESGAGDVFRRHPGFDSDAGLDRFTNCAYNLFTPCKNNDPTTGADHATAVASIILGDITQGQDADVTGALNRVQRSGIARDAQGVGITSFSATYVGNQVDAHNLRLINMSFHTANSSDCAGNTNWDAAVDSMFEGGTAVFKSAGNEGHSSVTNCTVSVPGAAIGAFAVAGHEVNSAEDEFLYNGSSRGGISTEGGGRSIIGLSGVTQLFFPYPHYMWPTSATDPDCTFGASGDECHYGTVWTNHTICCTSGSTPTVTGAAAIFRQWYLLTYSTLINMPGILYANMLLMGDGAYGIQSGSETPVGRSSTGFNNLWGAGRLRLRAFDATGLDGPYGWGTTSTCVDAGTFSYIPLNASNLGTDVDVLKAVIWTYDRRVESGTPHDKVALYLQKSADGGTTWTTVLSSITNDNKQRVYLTAPENVLYRLRLYGAAVTTDGEGCQTDSMKTYVAWLWEDSGREAAEYLDDVRPEDAMTWP